MISHTNRLTGLSIALNEAGVTRELTENVHRERTEGALSISPPPFGSLCLLSPLTMCEGKRKEMKPFLSFSLFLSISISLSLSLSLSFSRHQCTQINRVGVSNLLLTGYCTCTQSTFFYSLLLCLHLPHTIATDDAAESVPTTQQITQHNN